MGLKKIADDAYKNEIEKKRKENLEHAEKIVAQTAEILKERIGNEFPVKVISKGFSDTVFDVDNVKFRVNENGSVYIVKKCQKCDIVYQEYLMPKFTSDDQQKIFADIGKILSEPHNDYECQTIIKEKEGKKEPTVDEKLLNVLREFILEHAHTYDL